MSIPNYRITFGGEDIDYKNNFAQCLKHVELIQKIFKILDKYNVEKKWYFFEPYVEITWLDYHPYSHLIFKEIDILLKENGVLNHKILTPDDGIFCDWYCNSPDEREFGAATYAKSAEIALLFHEHAESIKDGRGVENQYVRRCHVLANQLALNDKQEGIFLLKRGILCLLFWFFGHHKAVWIYTKLFRFKY